jgi:pimeloyl-ACP methyl ester carboxylesterase
LYLSGVASADQHLWLAVNQTQGQKRMSLISLPDGNIDAEFHHDEIGAPSSTLVFLHEGLGSIGLWRTFPADVRGACEGPTTLVYSRHGYGRSGLPELPRSVTYMHHEAHVVLPELLSAFELERPVLIGHSDGASMALLYAAAGFEVAGLVLIAPHVFVEDITVTAIEAARVAYETTELRTKLARHHDDVDAAFLGWNDIWLSPEFRAWNIEDCLPSITCPILLIQSEADPYGTTAQLDAIETGVQGPTTRLLISTPGHAPHLEAPTETLEAVANFVFSLTQSG